jgi:predicted nucleic acid-binding protein
VSGSAAEPETIVCDTSFIGVHERAGGVRPNWPQAVVDRLDAAVLAISVISLAEVRVGSVMELKVAISQRENRFRLVDQGATACQSVDLSARGFSRDGDRQACRTSSSEMTTPKYSAMSWRAALCRSGCPLATQSATTTG